MGEVRGALDMARRTRASLIFPSTFALRATVDGPLLFPAIAGRRELRYDCSMRGVDRFVLPRARELRRDAERTKFLEAHGFRIMRFSNDAVIDGMDGVLGLILGSLNTQ
jgi:Protein of unknown function (DUF559)